MTGSNGATRWESHIRSHGLTLKGFAVQRGVSNSYLRRHLDCLYNVPSNGIVGGLSALTGVGPDIIIAQYYEDRKEIRQNNHDLIHELFVTFFPVAPILHWQFVTILGEGSILGFCKILCVNPILVKAELKQPLPRWLEEAYYESCPHFDVRSYFV